jgi:excisionase family DNA binding protein
MLACVSTDVSTAEAAKQIGVNLRTLQQWARDHVVEPAFTTPGGHYRWNVDELRRQLRERGHATHETGPVQPDAAS